MSIPNDCGRPQASGRPVERKNFWKSQFQDTESCEVWIMVFFLVFSWCVCWIGALTPREKAVKLASQMTLEEKLGMVHGYPGSGYAGYIKEQPKHGIPYLHLQDGPQGVGDGVKFVTCWPGALTATATWDPDLMEEYGAGLGKEQRGKGTNVMLGPMTNLARVPFDGRNYESLGEDPYLASVMVARDIIGIQSQVIIACVKHFLNNNQELDRSNTSATVDERTQHEIYLPPFKSAIQVGKVGSVMCSYNRINGTHACENKKTLNDYLKTYIGFEGFVMSDWGGTHSTVNSANNGLDMEMSGDTYFGKALEEAVSKGEVSKDRINDMAVRILTSMYQVGIMDTPQTGNLSVDVQSKENTELAQRIAEESTVLLKNDGILPIDTRKYYKIAIIGTDGDIDPTATGTGSGRVICPYVISPLEGIREFLISRKINISLSYAATQPIDSAAKVAGDADLAIIFVSTDSGEGRDRHTLGLGIEEDTLIEAVISSQPNSIVVVHGPSAVLMPWEYKTPAVVMAWLPGQIDGDAIARVLFGEVNPSGKLPVTFPISDLQTPLQSRIQYPGINQVTEYTEKLLMGYRWYDKMNETPLFPFGHGLSYTEFSYSHLKILNNPLTPQGRALVIEAEVKNVGGREGREVVQMYFGFPSVAGEPPRVLRGFEKIPMLKPGQNHTVKFTVPWDGEVVGIWDTPSNNWMVVPGTFEVHLGSSSRDFRLNGTFKVVI